MNIKSLESIFISRMSALIFASLGLILGSVAYFRFKNPVVIAPAVVIQDTRDPLEVDRERRVQKALELIGKKLYKPAQELLDVLAKEAPKNPFVLSALSLSEKKQGQFENAEAHLRTAIEVDGGKWTLHHNLGVLLFEKGKPQDSLVSFTKALELSPKNSQVLLSQARVQEMIGKFTDARLSYGKVIEAGTDGGTTEIVRDRLKKLDVLAFIERGDK